MLICLMCYYHIIMRSEESFNEFGVSYFDEMSDMECLWICNPTLEEDKGEHQGEGSKTKRIT